MTGFVYASPSRILQPVTPAHIAIDGDHIARWRIAREYALVRFV
jgi:hypothetical protein